VLTGDSAATTGDHRGITAGYTISLGKDDPCCGAFLSSCIITLFCFIIAWWTVWWNNVS
jgi:hypothetical protein